MTFLKQFLKPNRWKFGLLLVISIPTVAIIIPSGATDSILYAINCKLDPTFGSIRCHNYIIALIALAYNLWTFLIVLLSMPLMGLAINVLNLETLSPILFPISVFTSIIFSYLLSCLIYFIFSKIFKRKTFGE